jgi:arylsulfatase A-like enzyme
MEMKTLFYSIGLVLGIGLLSGSAVAADKRPNILFLLADDQRADTIRALAGNDRIHTPNLDALVARGMSFSRATCSYPICWVSRSEIITGTHGWENGTSGGGDFKSGLSYWGETFKQAGYDTWYVGKWHVRTTPSKAGYTKVAGFYRGGGEKWMKEQVDWKGFPVTGYRGWVFQSEDGKTKYPELGVGLTPDISAKFADAAIGLLNEQSDKPWLMQVNFTAPHDPLFMPPGMEGKYKTEYMKLPENFLPEHPFDHGNFDSRDEALLAWPRTEHAVKDLLRMYYSVVNDLDSQVGRILKAVEESGEMENTIVIYSSDHGMAVGSHGLRGKQNMYEHTINVPLIIAGKGIEAGSRSQAQVYLRELYPTTCDLVGIKIPEPVTAKSFADVLTGKTEKHNEDIFGYFTNAQRMIRSDDNWKLIFYPVKEYWQLFDLNSDPWEMSNLAGMPEHKERLESMKKRLEAWRKKQGDPLMAE